MRNKIIISALMALTAVTGVSAQVNGTSPESYFTRGVLMYESCNYAGCIDQLSHLSDLQTPDHLKTDAGLYIALSSLRLGSGDALQLLEDYLTEHPASVHRQRVETAIADWYFDHGRYGEALSHYRLVDISTMNDTDADACRYHKAYCLLMTYNLDEAERLYNRLSATAEYGNAARFYLGYVAYARKDYRKALEIFRNVNSTEPPADMTDYYLCQIYFLNGDYNKSLSTARRLLTGVAGTRSSEGLVRTDYIAEANRIAGESLYNLDDESEAIPYLKKYVATADNPLASTRYILGLSEYRAGNYDRAIADLTPVTAEDNAMGQSAYLVIGQAYTRLDNYNSALIAFEKAYRMTFDREVQETALYNYAVARMQGGRTPFGSSVATFENFLQQFPDSRYAPEIEEYIITGYMTDNNYAAALRSIRSIKSPSEQVLRAKLQVLYTLGTRELTAGNINEAYGYLTEAKEMSRYDAAISRECDLWIGDCLYRQNKYAEAARSYLAYIKAVPASDPNRAIACYNLGYARFGEKKFSDALTDFDRFIKSPGNAGQTAVADAYNRVADCYYYATRFERAATAYDKAYSLDPSVGDYALYQKALMKGMSRDYNAKIDGLKEMISRFPSSGLVPSALLGIAESYNETGKTDKAISAYVELASKYPGTTQGRKGYLLLASTYLYNGDRDAAISTYKKIISSYPTSEEAQMASDDLKRMYADAGNLNAYVQFIETVPNAPRIETSELDELTFESARREFLASSATGKLTEYLSQFPDGAHSAQALLILAETAEEKDNDDDALEYATRIVAGYPDSEQAVDALAIKADIEFAKGMGERALSSYKELESRSSSSAVLNRARIGIMRVSRDLGLDNDVIDAADRLLASSTLGADQRYEAIFARALALANTGRENEAIEAWSSISSDTGNLFGAKSAYYMAQFYFDNGNADKARATVDALIDSNTPHNYWLARGFILLSDIYRSQGSTFEADEYLKSLRENYPGEEADIFNMIDQRLK